MSLADDLEWVFLRPQVEKINFMLGRMNVHWTGLRRVGRLIRSGDISCRFDPALTSPAEYDLPSNTIVIKTGIDTHDISNQGLIIHEGTHAWSDLHRQRDHQVVAESAAYLAQTVFELAYRASGTIVSPDPETNAIFVAAEAIVRAHEMHRTPKVSLGWEDYASLRDAIAAHRYYRATASSPLASDGIRRR